MDAEQGYTRARQLLAEKCGNPHRASQQIQRELRDGKTVRSMKELDALSISLRQGIDCLKHIGMLAELNSQNTTTDGGSEHYGSSMKGTRIRTLKIYANSSTRRLEIYPTLFMGLLT